MGVKLLIFLKKLIFLHYMNHFICLFIDFEQCQKTYGTMRFMRPYAFLKKLISCKQISLIAMVRTEKYTSKQYVYKHLRVKDTRHLIKHSFHQKFLIQYHYHHHFKPYAYVAMSCDRKYESPFYSIVSFFISINITLTFLFLYI